MARHHARLIWLPMALMLVGNLAQAQGVLPTGGQVVAGSAKIAAPAGNTLSITQTSPRAVVNWNSFSVGQPNTVDFAQPTTSAAILNRVTGSTPSTIAGQIRANGQVYLVNPNGLALTPSGSVQVGGGFVASSLGISDQNFMEGRLQFNGNGASAPVSNAGTIAAGPGGYVALIGGTAANSGTLSVPLGKVALGSGEAATLDLNGGGFLQVAVPTGATTAQGQALVSNSGKVVASGGTVEMRAATVATAIRDAVNMSGTVAATSVSGQSGSITLSGGPGGAVNVTGALDASAPPDGSGGAIAVSGAKVRVGHHAILNASGAKGGTVLVGVSGPNGAGEADKTTIETGAAILATGEPGAGGFIETSGKSLKLGKALIDAGIGGAWLTDPLNLTIASTAATTIDTALNAGTNVTEQTTASGTSGSGTPSAGNGDIDVTSALSWGSNATLTLSAYNSILVSAPITVSGGGTLVLTYNNASANPSSPALTFVMGQGSAQFTTEADNPSLYINNGTPGSGNGTKYSLVYTQSEFNSMATNGNEALAAPVTFATAYAVNTVPISSFSGKFNGLGNTITGLTLTGNNNVGGNTALFGSVTGTISNIGLINPSLFSTGPFLEMGALVGTLTGTVTNSYAASTTTSIASTRGDAFIGGLVGEVAGSGTITDSYTSVAVSNTGPHLTSGGSGGLVGEVTGGGSLVDVYATGSVTGNTNSGITGGLVGVVTSSGKITNAYATGVLAGATKGGVAGSNAGVIKNAYFDTTTGVGSVAGSGAGTVTGGGQESTANLAGATVLAGLDGNSAWGNLNNQVTPYLANNPGFVFLSTDAGTSPTRNLVFTATQLQNIGSNLSGNYLLARDIDMTGVTGFTPIGTFTGDFNGLGNVISNLTINSNANFAGLFGESTGSIENIGLVGVSVSDATHGAAVGGLVGEAGGSITNAYVTGSVTASGSNSAAGGLVGASEAAISNSYSTGTVAGNLYVGGLVGDADNGSIQNAYSTATVTASGSVEAVGGLVGLDSVIITDVYAAGAVSSSSSGAFVGGVVGEELGSVTNGYWNQDRSTGIAGGATTGGTGVTTLTGAAMLTASDYSGFTFVSTPQAANNTNAWVIVMPDGSLAANSTASAGSTMPMLASEYSTTIQNAHQLQLMAMNLSGSYALGRNIDATATGSSTSNTTGSDVWGCAAAPCTGAFIPIGGETTAAFTGSVNGQNNTISGLTVALPTTQGVGLFGDVKGSVDNLNLSGVSISGGTDTGGLVGYLQGGSIGNSHVTGTVTAPTGGSAGNTGGLVGEFESATVSSSSFVGTVIGSYQVGGLVGDMNGGSITQSSAGGVVSGSNDSVGGLVGQANGTITQSFAAGSTAGRDNVGGLVGDINAATTIDQSYALTATTWTGFYGGGLVGHADSALTLVLGQTFAAGPVTGGSFAGGLVGNVGSGGSVNATASYWDKQTTGQTSSAGGTGETTTTLQAGLPSDFDQTGTVWGIVAGKSYPYLCWQFGGCGSTTPQVVSGTVYQDQGTTPAGSGITVSGLVNGTGLASAETGGTVVTGADGYYYYLLAPNTIPSGSGVLTIAQGYTAGVGTANGAAFSDNIGSGGVAGLAILANTLHELTADAADSTLHGNLAAALGANTLPAGLVNLRIDASGAFDVDDTMSFASGTVTLNDTAGAITESAGTISATTLTGSSVGGAALTAATNAVGTFGPWSDTGIGSSGIALTDSQALTTAGAVGSTGNISLTTISGNLTIGISSGDTLTADPSVGTITLTSAGSITETTGAVISGAALTGSSVGGAALTGANQIAEFAGFTNTGSGDVALTSGETLATDTITDTVGDITLTTTSGDIMLMPATAITASGTGTVTLNSAGGVAGSAGSPADYPTISAGSLSVTAVNSVDLPGANTVGTLAAAVTGTGASFDLSNAQALTIGSVGALSGVTTNGTDGSEANIVLQTTAGDLDIVQPVSTNGANGSTLGLSLGQIGLQAAGKITLNPGFVTTGNLVGFAVEAIAGDTISLNGSASPAGNRIGGNDDLNSIAQTAGTFAGEVTGAGKSLTFVDQNAGLVVDQVTTIDPIAGGVAAGSLQLPFVSGVITNGGQITLVSHATGVGATTTLTLNLPVNANNGSSVLGASPGLVQLISAAGDVTQGSAGVVVAGQLYAESDFGNVYLTAANHVGANDGGGGIAATAGLVGGYADGNFQFVNHNAGITIDTLGCGCLGIFTQSGSIDLATTGAGAIIVNKPLNSGYEINVAVAPGYGFTNNAFNDAAFDAENGLGSTAGLDTSYSGVPVTILADQMTLSGGTVNAGGGVLVLAPATPTNPIVLGAAGTPGVLGLQTADLANVQAGAVQIGYRNPDGTVSFTGNIGVTGNFSINTGNIEGLLLVTGGAVTATGSGAIVGSSPATLELGIIASGTNTLNGANDVGTLAAYIDGANPSLSFTNSGAVTVGTLGGFQAGVSLDANGFPNPVQMTGAPSDPLSGITTSGGAATTGGLTLTTSTGGITVAAPIATGGQPVTLTAGGGIAFDDTVMTTGTFRATAGAGGGGGGVGITQDAGGILTLGGSSTLTDDSTGGAITLTEANAISGTVSLTTTGGDAALTSASAFTLASAGIGGGLAVVDAAGLTISGAVSSPGTISLTGPLTLVSGAAVSAPTIDISGASTLAIDGDAVLGQAGSTIDLAHAAASGTVSEAATATVIAGWLAATDGLSGTVSLVGSANDITALSAIGVTGVGNGFSLVTASPLAVNGALTTASGPVSLTTTGAGSNLRLAAAAAAPGNAVTLSSGGTLIEAAGGTITADTLGGSAAGSASLDGANEVGTLNNFTTTGAGSALSFTDARALTVSNLTAAGALVLGATGPITQAAGPIAAADLVVMTQVSGGASVTLDNSSNAVPGNVTLTSLDQSGNPAAGNLTFFDSTGFTIAANSANAPGIATSTGAVTLQSGGTIAETGTISTSGNLVVVTLGGGAITLNQAGNAVSGDVTLTSLDNGGSHLAGGAIIFAANSGITIGNAGGFQTGIGTTGPATLQASGPVTENGGAIITAGTLTGSSAGGAAMAQSNNVATLGPFANTGSGSLVFTDQPSLTTAGTVSSAGDLTLTTTAGNLTLGGNVVASGGTMTLNSAGTIAQSGGIIDPGSLLINAVGSVSLPGANTVDTLAASITGAGSSLTFNDTANNLAIGTVGGVSGVTTSNGAITLSTTTSGDLTLNEPINAGTGTVTLISAGAITENRPAIITGSTLTGSATGDANLDGSNSFGEPGNLVEVLGSFASSGGSLDFSNAQSLTTAGNLTAQTGLNLITYETGSNLILGGNLTAPGVLISSAGTVTQSSGIITASSSFSGESVGGASLTGANKIATFDGFLNYGSGLFSFNDAQSLATLGQFGSAGDLIVTTTGSGSDLSLAGASATGSVTVAAAGNLTIGSVSGGGAVTLATLGKFVNTGTVTAGSTWLIYSTNPSADTDGRLAPAFIQYAASYNIGTLTGAAPAATGNGLLYSVTPQIAVDSVTKTYDGTTALPTSASAYTSSGAINNDSVSLDVSGATGSYASADAGLNIPVVLSGITVSANHNGVPVFDYGLGVAGAGDVVGTILPKALTAGLTGTVSKTYDGSAAATLAAANYILSGIVGNDSVSLNDPSGGTYGSANVGTGIGVNVTGLALVGSAAGNYTLTSDTANASVGTITPATVTAGLTGTVAKIYDGTTAANLTPANYTLTGIIGSDNVSLNDPATGIYGSPNAGAGIGVGVSGLALGGTAAGNYALASTAANANIGTITPATVIAGLTGTVAKIYDGTTAATLTPANYTLTGIIGGDNVSLNDPTTGIYGSPNAGAGIGVGVSSLALGGTAAGNYALASTSANASIGTITPATVTAGLTGTVAKIYDGTTAATLTPANYTLTGIIGSDNVTLDGPIGGNYASANVGVNIPVGVSGLALTGSAAGNYTLANTSAKADIGAIEPRLLMIAADELLRPLGAQNPPLTYRIIAGTLVAGDSLTGALTTTAKQDSSFGFYPITQGTLAASANYTVIFSQGALVVLPFELGASPDRYLPWPSIGFSPQKSLSQCSSATVASILQQQGSVPLFGAGGCGSL